MTAVLVLGGTGWLGGRVARRWVEDGAEVTCVARGSRPAPDGARLVATDRSLPGAYDELVDRMWDEVVDVSSDAAAVAGAVTALGGKARHWTYVSTVSVYADDSVAGTDETAAVVGSPPVGAEREYPYAKAAAEASVRRAVGERAAVVRPGLIVGPGDVSDRFGYWVARFAAAADGPVLVPDAAALGAAVIDVDDLADLLVTVGAQGWTGTVNAVGDPRPLADVFAAARAVAGHRGELVEASPEWLLAHDVSYWMGPRSLPLWLPRETVGHWTRSNARYRALGGRIRPLEATLRRTLEDERARGLDRERRSGLTRAEEIGLIEQLRQQESVRH